MSKDRTRTTGESHSIADTALTIPAPRRPEGRSAYATQKLSPAATAALTRACRAFQIAEAA